MQAFSSIVHCSWLIDNFKLAKFPSSETENGEDSNPFSAWLRSLRHVSRIFNSIFAPLGLQNLVSLSEAHLKQLVNRLSSLPLDSIWVEFMMRVITHTKNIKSSVELPEKIKNSVFRLLLKAHSLQTLGISGSGEMKSPEFANVDDFLSSACGMSTIFTIVDDRLFVKKITSYDPYLRDTRLPASRSQAIQIAMDSPIRRSKYSYLLDLLVVDIPINQHFSGFVMHDESFIAMRALVLENYDRATKLLEPHLPHPSDFVGLESLPLERFDLTIFFECVALTSFPLLERLVVKNCINVKSERMGVLKESMKSLLLKLPGLRELCIEDDWQSYFDIIGVFTIKSRIERLELVQIAEFLEDHDTDQMSASELHRIARMCPEMKMLRINIGEELYVIPRFLELTATGFRQLETLILESNEQLHLERLCRGPCISYKLNAKSVAAKLNKSKFGKLFRTIALEKYAVQSGSRFLEPVLRFLSLDGGKVEEFEGWLRSEDLTDFFKLYQDMKWTPSRCLITI
ncbi:uncharacterized protein RSE6_01845 [Rhynchosporium secalis]|uniref:Uncharacterized protein n=1 Tax=Rhynchosporium secalis TaxID=38038 RepID=A0A1E1LYU9_RHYSE|nr:uncharacterized protein RSE6_01845 [Rhynchosporium secalis]